MKKLNLILSVTALIFSFTSCKKDKITEDKEESSVQPNLTEETGISVQSNFTVMTNGTDHLITKYSSDETEIDFFGQRDQNGVPTVVDQISVNVANDTTIYKLDNTGRPEKVIIQNGTYFDFNWTSQQKAVLTILSNNGQTQINTEINFAETAKKSQPVTTKKSIRKNRSLSLNYREINNSFSFKSLETKEDFVNVSVYSCGGLVDADVSVFVKQKSGELLGVFPTTRIDNGQYTVSLPSDLAPTINPSEVCSDIVTALNNSYITNELPEFYSILCASISEALAASNLESSVAAEIAEACESLTTGMELYSGILGASNPSGESSLSHQICNAEVLNRIFTEDVIIYARAKSTPNNTYSEYLTVSGSSNFPASLSINMSSSSIIKTLTLSPNSPAEGEDYEAVCNIYCLEAGASVKLSIVGTDEYTDEIIYPITSMQSEGEFTLYVPGAETGVKDVVTVEVTLPNGSVLTRTAWLVFN